MVQVDKRLYAKSRNIIPVCLLGCDHCCRGIPQTSKRIMSIFRSVHQPSQSWSADGDFRRCPEVRGGVVLLLFSEVRSKRYLRGTTLSLSDDGKFQRWQGQPAFVIGGIIPGYASLPSSMER